MSLAHKRTRWPLRRVRRMQAAKEDEIRTGQEQLDKSAGARDTDEKRSQAMEDIVDTRDIVDTEKTLKAIEKQPDIRRSFASSLPVHHSSHGAAPRPTSWASRSLTKAPVHLLPVTKKANNF